MQFVAKKGGINTFRTRPDFIALLYDYHHRKIRKQAIIVWDGLSAHYSSAEYFESFQLDWFEFYYFPSHSLQSRAAGVC
ncbi:hypothetical protein FACS1894170_02720 [Planctomycetales bacterium]|nr:hypothetical protein FACS1894170_02720 [Planctomycetales bacterium]